MKRKNVIKRLKEEGFKPDGHKPHGCIYSHADVRFTTVGSHYKNGTIPSGTLKAIERQAGFRF